MNSIPLKVRKGISSVQIENFTLDKEASIYFMGICGTAMSSLAIFLKKEQFLISGSDQNIYPPISTLLKSHKIPIYSFRKENISKKINLVILGNVIKKTNLEVEALEELGIPYISLPDFLEQVFLNKKKNIVACGTHGKSTVTSLMAHAGHVAGLSPSFFVGGVSQDLESSFSIVDSPWFVIEGDEYDTAFFAKYPKFFHYNPFALIITGIEFDHFDIYKSIDEITSVFYKLIAKVPKEGVVCVHSENKWLDEIKKRSQAPVITYGLQKGDYQSSPIKFFRDKTKFDIKHKNEIYSCELGIHGEHNVLNALSVFALTHYLKWPQDKVLEGLKSFKGMKRRLQKRGEINNIIIYEDFAHHPTAVRMTLNSLKKMYPENNLFAVFEPRSFTSRTSLFQQDYALSFRSADVTFLFPPYKGSSIPIEKRFSSQKLVEAISNTGKKAFLLQEGEDPVQSLQRLIRPGDIVVVMSNGDIEYIIQALLKES